MERPTLTPLPKYTRYTINDIRYITEESVLHLNAVHNHNQMLLNDHTTEVKQFAMKTHKSNEEEHNKEIVQLQKELAYEKSRNETNKKTYETYVKDYEKMLKSHQVSKEKHIRSIDRLNNLLIKKQEELTIIQEKHIHSIDRLNALLLTKHEELATLQERIIGLKERVSNIQTSMSKE